MKQNFAGLQDFASNYCVGLNGSTLEVCETIPTLLSCLLLYYGYYVVAN